MRNIRASLEPLVLLDVRECDTVAKLVAGLRDCSFGARMLGETCATIVSWIQNGFRPNIVYDGKTDCELYQLLKSLGCSFFKGPMTSEHFSFCTAIGKNTGPVDPVLAVGYINERIVQSLFEYPQQVIWINNFGQACPGQIRDGHFPNAVFADPRFVIPVLSAVLDEQLEGIHTPVSQFVQNIAHFGGLSSEVTHAHIVMRDMIDDPDCTVFLTMSGAMTIAKMGLVICEMIDREMVHYIASTGALMAHGLVESVGLNHFKYDPRFNDEELGEQKLNRVTDTLEPEENLNHVAEILDRVLHSFSGDQCISPSILNGRIGEYLVKHFPSDRGILKSAYEMGVAVAIPAFVDSEIGNDVFVHNKHRREQKRKPVLMDLEIDSQMLLDIFTHANRRGIISIGGGVPRNNTQNVAPLIEIVNARLGTNLPEAPFDTGCRICPDPMWFGHLSGCTYSENASWRKMDPQAIAHGKFAEVHADATIILPFVIRALMDQHT